jgi:ABC-2 type transport system ATP-binding protein
VAAVQGLDLTVRRRELFGLVGPDGAGKSTAIRLLCGILKPGAGSGTVLGFDLATQAERIKARVGYLSQDFTLYGDLTVAENIEFFARIHGVRDFRARRERLLDFTRLAPFRRRLADALSGGMKKKLALACTLIHTPEIIFLDEPSTGVDPVSRGEFWNILSEILEEGVTIVLTTPYLDEAERCHRIALMHGGRVLLAGAPDEVRAALPRRVHRFECADVAGAYRLLRRGWPPTRLVMQGEGLHLSVGRPEEARAAAQALERAGLGPVRQTAVDPPLEDVFVGLLGEGGT